MSDHRMNHGPVLHSETMSLSGPAFTLGLRAAQERRAKLNSAKHKRLRFFLEALLWSMVAVAGVLIAMWSGR